MGNTLREEVAKRVRDTLLLADVKSPSSILTKLWLDQLVPKLTEVFLDTMCLHKAIRDSQYEEYKIGIETFTSKH